MMKKSNKMMINGLLVTGLLAGCLMATTTTANASSYSKARNNSVKLVWRKSMNKHAMHGTKGYLYSKHLGRKYKSLKSYPKTTWYTSKHEKLVVKKDGHSKIYYYVTSGNKKHSGWIWRGYLKSGKNPRADTTSNKSSDYYTNLANKLNKKYANANDGKSAGKTNTSKTNTDTDSKKDSNEISVTEYANIVNQTVFTEINNERAKAGVSPVTTNASWREQKVADVRMSQIMEQQPSTGWVLSHDYNGKTGSLVAEKQLGYVSISTGETLSVGNISDCTQAGAVAKGKSIVHKMVYDDANMNWGHRDTLLAPNSVRIGISASTHNGYVFVATEQGPNKDWTVKDRG